MILLEKKRINGADDIFHFVGIGGIGMSGMAEIMHNLGYKVQGSDLSINNNIRRLEALGIKIFPSQDGGGLAGVSYVVISSAIKPDNPELIAAKAQHIPVISRAEMLAELMRLKCSIAVSGSHGKTTTTSMVAALFEEAGLAPTVINGGIINNRKTNAYLGKSDYLIAEADESDATFIKIPATVGIITNIDPEHMDFYADFDELYNSFKAFINNLPFYGFAVACIDHPTVKKLVDETLRRKVITYGIDSKEANIVASNIRLDVDHCLFDVKINIAGLENQEIKDVMLPAAGRHNVLNSLAAIATGLQMHIAPAQIKSGFKNFAGVKRRFTKVGRFNGATIIDDYAHHPVEIKATLDTARIVAGHNNGRVFAIFQPHRYSRLSHLFDDFVSCFGNISKLYITDVFAAGERPIAGVDSKHLVSKINELTANTELAEYTSDEKALAKQLLAQVRPNDIVIFMGAGSITKWAASAEGELEAAKAELAQL